MVTIMSGLIIGSFIGDSVKNIDYLNWLSYSKTIGLTSPMNLNLEIISIQFSFLIRFTISGIIGILISILVYKKLS